MRGPYLLELINEAEIKSVFQAIGCDEAGSHVMLKKGRIFPLLVKEVKSPGANVLKQQMLSLGGEAVVGRGVIDCSQEYSDVLLLGTLKEYQGLLAKIKQQPWGLRQLGVKLAELLTKFGSKNRLTWEWPDRKLAIGDKVLVMGILNITPDSFSDGGKFIKAEEALAHAWAMVEEGADLIDVGGESTRPGFAAVSAEEELARVIPVLEKLVREIPVPLSLDTYKAEVAEQALSLGVHLINDVGGGLKDRRMAEVVARYQAPVVIMHNPGTAEYGELVPDIFDSLAAQVAIFEAAGVAPEKIVIDPGIGFGKDWQESLCVMKRLKTFGGLGRPVLLGVSRKSFIGKVLDCPVSERLAGSLAAAAWGVLNGTDILRVHDVRETVRLVRVLEAINAIN